MYADYAPELNVVGAVLGSPVADLGHAFDRLNGSFYSGLPAMVVAALSHVYPGLDRIIAEHATPEGKETLERIEKMTTAHAVLRMIGKDMDDLVDWPLQQILDTPEVRHVFESIKLGTTVPTPSGADRPGGARPDRVRRRHRRTDRDLRQRRRHVTYHRDTFGEHMLLHPLSAPMTLRWLRDRFAGRPLSDHRVRTAWPTLLNPSTYRGMIRLGLITAKVVTGRRVDRQPLSALDQ